MEFSTVSMLVPVTLAGATVGVVAGLFGVGGGFLLVPVLNIVLRIPMELAVGAGACQVLGPATTSLLARRVGREHLRLPLTIAGGLFVGVFCGAQILESAKQYGESALPGKTVSLTEFLVLATYFVFMLVLGVFSLWEVRRFRQNRPLKRGWIAGWRIPPYTELPGFDRLNMSVTTLAWFGLVIGFVAGMLGMSGGLILLPGLIYLLGLKTHQSVSTSLVIVWIVAAQATAVHAWHGNVELALVMALLFGGTIGARIGSQLSDKLVGHQLRESFGWLLVASAILIAGRLGRLLLP